MKDAIKRRIAVEKAVVRAFVKSALEAGYRLSVSLERGFDPDVMAENKVLGITDRRKIMAEAFAGDEAHIFVHEPEGRVLDDDGRLVTRGWVYIVLGNDGYDVISDYTTNLDKLGLMTKANEVSEKYEPK